MKDKIIATVMLKDASLAARLMAKLDNIGNTSEDLNRCFRKILNSGDMDTIGCRKYLEDGLPDKEWLNQITKYVIPHLIKYKLPRD